MGKDVNRRNTSAFSIGDMLKKNTMFLALVVVMALFQVLIMSAEKGSMFQPANVTNLISQNSYVVILAVGMLLCILTGGNIDLSVGSVVVFIGAIAGNLIVLQKMNIYLAMIICLLFGILIGACHGFWIAYIRIPAFIVTLSGMLLWRGLAQVILQGQTISPFPENFLNYFNSYFPSGGNAVFIITFVIGILISVFIVTMEWLSRLKKIQKNYKVEHVGQVILRLVVVCGIIMVSFYLLGQNKGVPVILVLLSIVVMVYGYFTSKTVPGRHIYAMGGNEKSAKLSGINTNRVLFAVYVNMGFLAALAALVCVARFNSASPNAGLNYELDAIGACYIGGASAYGGTGTIGGTVIGAIFMGVLNNGMSILGVDVNWQRAVKGVVLLAAVVFDVLSKKKGRTA